MNDFATWIVSEEDGQGMVEYGLIIALISVVLIGVLGNMTGALNTIFTAITTALNKAANP